MSDIYSQVLDESEPRETKADIVEYYQSTYPGFGRGGWKQRLVNDMAAITGMKPKNLEKRFDPQRLNNPEDRNADQYAELGEQLPPKPPENGFHVEGTIWVQYSEECVDREVDFDIAGDEADELVRLAFAGLGNQAIANSYNETDLDDPNSYAACGDDSWNVS